MPSFAKYSNYDPKTNVSGVVIGADAPVLEVELNEMQQIMDEKLRRLSLFLGNTLIAAKPDGGVFFDPALKAVTIKDCVALAGKFSAIIPEVTLPLTEEEPFAYVRVTERVVKGTDNLLAYGNLNSDEEVENPIIDERVGVETSRRRVVEFALMSAEVMPETADPDTIQIIPLGEMHRVETPVEPDPDADPEAPTPDPVVSYSFERKTAGGSMSEMLDEFSDNIQKVVDAKIAAALEAYIPKNPDDDKPKQYITTRYENNVLHISIEDPAANGETLAPYYENKVLYLQFAENAEMMNGTTTPASLPIATKDTPGIVQIGAGINVTPNGVISADVSSVSEAVADTAAAKVISQMADVDEDEVDEMFKENGKSSV